MGMRGTALPSVSTTLACGGAVEPVLLGLVFGATVGVAAGLLSVALCHYLGVARLGCIVVVDSVTGRMR